eukprot:1806081-Pyramimonas_sp.AAC.1
MGHHMRMLLEIASVIIQGCPASGVLLAFSMGPCLQRFRAAVDQPDRGLTRTRAGDVGMAL